MLVAEVGWEFGSLMDFILLYLNGLVSVPPPDHHTCRCGPSTSVQTSVLGAESEFLLLSRGNKRLSSGEGQAPRSSALATCKHLMQIWGDKCVRVFKMPN